MIASACFTGDAFGQSQSLRYPEQLDPKKHKLLILWGGEDISPYFYNEKPVRSHAGGLPSIRDEVEADLTHAAIEKGVPILGICRGAQLLCALGGGKLWQHVENHHRNHPMIYQDREIITNSCHHQMLIPTSEMEVLAAAPCQSPRKWRDSDDPIENTDPEPEIVFFPKMKALGVQGHPEWVNKDSNFFRLVEQLIKEKLCPSL